MPRALVALCVGLVLLGPFSHVDAAQPATPSDAVSPSTMGPVHTAGSKLVDGQGQEVRITGVNWFGLETDTFAPHGLWARNYGDMLDQIAAAGFNTIRIPYSNQLFDAASTPKGIDYQKNPDLQGLNGLRILDAIVAGAGQRGLSVLFDRHRPTATGQSELWYTPAVPESRWIQDWVMLAQRYAGNPTVIGADLHNEPHGPATWGDGSPTTDWRLAAERAGNAILAVNPDWLIVVEGIEHYGNDWYWWGGNLAGVRDAGVRLSVPAKLVYSTHDYGPGVYGQAWFGAPDFPANLPKLWRDHWAFLEQDDLAPVLVGEFGGRSVGSDKEGVWQRTLLAYMRDNNLSYTYWAWNPDSGDTGGILADDWSTLDQSKLAMLTGYQWSADGSAPASVDVAQAQPAAADGSAPASVDVAQAQPAAPVAAPAPAPAIAPAPAVPPIVAAPPAAPGVVSVPGVPMPGYAAGGPFDPDPQHALGGVGGPNDPDAVHRQARARDEQLYLVVFGKPWQYAAYVKGPN
ncbi:MAG TPA: glycoside hydrolase family 5 protein [Chloroflexota bacterium]|nr:glycoside hydrolase family 5 protein [Chloroflexota bacterium]